MIKVTVVIPSGGFAATAIAPLEVFYCAGSLWNECVGRTPEPRFTVEAASVCAGPVDCAYPLTITPEKTIEQVADTDLVFLPTVGNNIDATLARHAGLMPWLRRMHDRGSAIAAVCSGVVFPAAAGLLDGHRATTHWALADVCQDRFPKVQWQPERMVTEDQGMFCGGGVYAAMDVALYIVQKYCGHDIAVQASRALLVDMPRTYQSAYAVVPLSAPHHDEKVRQAEELIQARYAGDVRITDIARSLGMTSRTLMRRFRQATGRLPGAYVQAFRISVARDLLETSTDTVQTIGAAVGYSDVAFFRRLFKRYTGMAPVQYRTQFMQM